MIEKDTAAAVTTRPHPRYRSLASAAVKPSRKSNADPLALVFRGLEWCDGCGARLDLGDRLAGLCAACREPTSAPSRDGQAIPSGSVRGRR